MAFENEDAFKKGLKTNADQTAVIDALFQDADFLKLWNYLKNCKVKIKLKIKPGLKIGGVERFGGYVPGTKTLIINPTKKEHADNPQELVDTLTHELTHAVMDLKKECGNKDYPFNADVFDAYHDPVLKKAGIDKKGTKKKNYEKDDKTKKHWEDHYGDSASNPKEEYIDINDAAQRWIIELIKRLIKATGKGKKTITFENEEKRKEKKKESQKSSSGSFNTIREHYVLISSLMGLAVAVLDLVILFNVFGTSFSLFEKLTGVGIVTFFGMLIVSSFFEEHRHNHKQTSNASSHDLLKATFVSGRGIMRKAIASSLIVMYFIVIAQGINTGVADEPLVAKPDESEAEKETESDKMGDSTGETSDSDTNDDSNSGEQTQTESETEDSDLPVATSLLQHFTALVSVIIAFYFGKDIVKIIWENKKKEET